MLVAQLLSAWWTYESIGFVKKTIGNQFDVTFKKDHTYPTRNFVVVFCSPKYLYTVSVWLIIVSSLLVDGGIDRKQSRFTNDAGKYWKLPVIFGRRVCLFVTVGCLIGFLSLSARLWTNSIVRHQSSLHCQFPDLLSTRSSLACLQAMHFMYARKVFVKSGCMNTDFYTDCEIAGLKSRKQVALNSST